MKKKLQLNIETVRVLTEAESERAAGAMSALTSMFSCDGSCPSRGQPTCMNTIAQNCHC